MGPIKEIHRTTRGNFVTTTFDLSIHQPLRSTELPKPIIQSRSTLLSSIELRFVRNSSSFFPSTLPLRNNDHSG